MAKICSRCKKIKGLADYAKGRPECKVCASDWARKYHQKNKEERNKQKRKYYRDNTEKIKERKQKYRQNNKEKIKEYTLKYRQENREKINTATREYYQNNKKMVAKKAIEYNLRKYNLTFEKFSQILSKQGGVCLICKKPPNKGRRLHVDHCHKTGVTRALLCINCNRGLGFFIDDPYILQRAIEYLVEKKWEQLHN